MAWNQPPMTVTDLGRWVVSGNSASHAVKLVNADGTDVSNGGATVRTAGMTAGRFAYAPLAAPVTLSAYTSYFVVSQEAVGGDQWYDYANTPITLTAAGGALAISAPNGSTAYTLASNGAGKTFGPVNLEFASGLTGGSWAFAQEVRYLYDGRRVIQERDGSNAPTVSYTRGKDLSGTLEGAGGIGGLLARSSGYNSSTGAWSTHYYYHADGNGNITYLVDGSQAMAATYEYDPYGNLLSSSGTLASANLYRFSSKEYHANSGLYYYGFRFYEPNTQRWVNRDPLGDEASVAIRLLPHAEFGPVELWDQPNNYAIVYNDPVVWVDAYGLYTAREWFQIWLAGVRGSFQGAAAELDGANPFGNPMSSFYDPCDRVFKFSRAMGTTAAASLSTAGALRTAATLGARPGSVLNSNPYFRIGPGRWGKDMVPRISIGGDGPPWWNWLSHWRV